MAQHIASQWKLRSIWKCWKRLAINKVLLSFRICLCDDVSDYFINLKIDQVSST